MFTRMVLPRLGGSPSVWSVAMVFFQSMLLAGYAYAHILMSSKNRYIPIVVHLALLVLAACTLPLSIAENWGVAPVGVAAPFWLLGLFAISIGLPFFALAANNPLMQAWFARMRHPDAQDPYFLYAASNIGSFRAVDPDPASDRPSAVWQTPKADGVDRFYDFDRIDRQLRRADASQPAPRRRAPKPDHRRQTRLAHDWPLGLYLGRTVGPPVAVTAYISTDIAAAPLLWVIPLSLYLLTWILVFQRRPLIPHRTMLLLQPFAIRNRYSARSTTPHGFRCSTVWLRIWWLFSSLRWPATANSREHGRRRNT